MKNPHELDRTIRLVRESVSEYITDEEIVRKFQTFKVSCQSDVANLSTQAGQTALITFVSLVARMGVQIQLEVPEVKIIGHQPPLQKHFLLEGLLDLGNDLIPGSSIGNMASSPPDMTFVFGNTPCTPSPTPAWRVSGRDWEGKVSQIQVVGNQWTADWPIGAMTAAALGAVEVYKGVVRQIGVTDQQSLFFEAVPQAKWDWDSSCPFDLDLDCGSIDMVSAGAISQATMYVLLRVPGLRLIPRIFDDDVVDGTTLNRGMLTRFSDIGQRKAEVIARNITSEAIPEKLVRDALVQYTPLASSVLVGVDDIPSRWAVQKATMGWLGIGGTSHYGTITSSHEAGEPCAGCLHWIDDSETFQILPTVSFVSFWAGLSLAVRFLRHRLGRPYPREKQSLWLVPLRMDDPNAGWWSPVSRRKDCPVECVKRKGLADLNKVVELGDLS